MNIAEVLLLFSNYNRIPKLLAVVRKFFSELKEIFKLTIILHFPLFPR